MSNPVKFALLLGIGIVLAVISVWLIGGKKQEFSSTATINAIPSQIFPYLVQADLKKQWVEGLVEQELSDLSMYEKDGVSVRLVEELDGANIDSEGEVIRYVPNQNFNIRTDSSRMQVTTVAKLNSDNNKTKVTYRKIVRYNGLDRITNVFFKSDIQQSVERDLKKLVSVVETAFPDGGVLEPDAPTPAVTTGDGDEEQSGEGAGDTDPPGKSGDLDNEPTIEGQESGTDENSGF